MDKEPSAIVPPRGWEDLNIETDYRGFITSIQPGHYMKSFELLISQLRASGAVRVRDRAELVLRAGEAAAAAAARA